LSVGERQRVEIVRCLPQEPKLSHGRADLGADPAGDRGAVRDPAAARLRGLLDPLYLPQAEEIRSPCDRATILRGGKVVGSCDPKRETARGLAEMMIGTTLTHPQREPGEIGACG
jgi:simple sugar transport system ATP-binding protein